jgi:hypothetical protein
MVSQSLTIFRVNTGDTPRYGDIPTNVIRTKMFEILGNGLVVHLLRLEDVRCNWRAQTSPTRIKPKGLRLSNSNHG